MKNTIGLDDLSKNLEGDITYKINSLHYLASAQEQTQKKYSNEYLQFGKAVNKDNETFNQLLNDAILNSMASLIDYYCVYCMIKLGVEPSKVRRVQYRALTKKFLLENSVLSMNEKTEISLQILRDKFNDKVSSEHNLKIEDININEYWASFLGDAISRTLWDYGILKEKHLKLHFNKEKNTINLPDEIKTYNHCMRFLYINPANPNGARYGIYIDLNNFLKHNAVPYFTQRKENFDNPAEDRLYSFFSIENERRIFLKEGILKDIAQTDFTDLKNILQIKLSKGNENMSALEQQWEIGPIISVDKKNGIASLKSDNIYFFVDNVLMAKSPTATLVDARTSFRYVISSLIREIESKIQYFNKIVD